MGGDDHGEAYTAIVWGVGVSHDSDKIVGAETFSSVEGNMCGAARRTLQRRSQKDGATWERIVQLANDYLPKPCNLHPWPSVRFAVKHSR